MSNELLTSQPISTYIAGTSTAFFGLHLTLNEVSTWTGIMAGITGILVTIFMAIYNVKHKRLIIKIMENKNENRRK